MNPQAAEGSKKTPRRQDPEFTSRGAIPKAISIYFTLSVMPAEWAANSGAYMDCITAEPIR